MYEIDFLPVGDKGQSGDAIALRFSRPDRGVNVVMVIDAGFQTNGDALVEHVDGYYDTDQVDLAVVTHPDGDHIGGMGRVIENLDVAMLCIHRIGDRGGDSLPAAGAVEELIELAESRGTTVVEPFTGNHALGGAVTFLGPDEGWYEQLVKEQVAEAPERALRKAKGPSALPTLGQRVLAALPVEVPFDDDGGTNPRNNSSIITLVQIDGKRFLFTGDAGVPALESGWEWLVSATGDTTPPALIQIPHAGSRHNGSSDLLNLILGPTGQAVERTAVVSVASKSKRHPSPRIANAYMRRGYAVYETRGRVLCDSSPDAPSRGWSPATRLQPMDESEDD
ncbi:MAG TPA: MBL fold metallo-hydrolase [Actinomycetota bacterium]|nr:MBL fold metallo-hydrolase [Actinomycetota bacterium]